MNFWAICDPETKRNESFSLHCRHCEGSLHFIAGPEGATCAEPVLPCATGVPCCSLPCFHPCFCSLLSVNVPIWNHLSLPLFHLGCIKKLYLFFVYFLHHLQFPITKSELVLLWPLRSRPVISVVLILRVSLFAVHSWLSFCFRHMVWIYVFLVLKQVNLKVSFDFGQSLFAFTRNWIQNYTTAFFL